MTLNFFITALTFCLITVFTTLIWWQQTSSRSAKILAWTFSTAVIWVGLRLIFVSSSVIDQARWFILKTELALVPFTAWMVLWFILSTTGRRVRSWFLIGIGSVLILHAVWFVLSPDTVLELQSDPLGGLTYQPGPAFIWFGLFTVGPLLLAMIISTWHTLKNRKYDLSSILIWLGVLSPLVGVVSGVFLPLLGINSSPLGFLSAALMAGFFFVAIQLNHTFSINFRNISILGKVLSGIVLASILPLVLFGLVNLSSFEQSQIKLLGTNRLEQTKEKTRAIEATISQYSNLALGLARLDGWSELVSEEPEDATQAMMTDVLFTLAQSDPLVYQLRFTDTDGTEKIKVTTFDGLVEVVPEPSLQNKATMSYFQDAQDLLAGEVAVSELELNREHGQITVPYDPTIRLVTPVFDENQKIGFIIVNLHAERLFSFFSSEALDEIIVIDQAGNYLFHHDSTLAWSGPNNRATGHSIQADYPELADRFLDNQPEIISSQTTPAIWSKVPIKFYGEVTPKLFLIRETSQSSLYQPINAYRLNLLLLTGLGSLFSLIVAIAVARSIFQPIQQLASGVDQLSKGDFSVRVAHEGTDEIARLSQTFDQLSQSVISSQAEIRQKVEDQTHQIQEKNQFLEQQQNAMMNILEDVEQEKNRFTKLAQDLKKFQLAVENATDQIVITDPEGKVLYANPSTTRLTGYTNEEIMGQKAGNPQLWGGLMGQKFYQEMWDTLKKQKQEFSGRIENQRKTGEKYTVETNIAPILDDQGELQFFVAIERDVTQEIEVDRMKTEFISLASHQLKTPLTSIKWYLEILSEHESLDEEEQGLVESIQDSSERMIDLVNALLNVSRIESGRIIVEPVMTSLAGLLDTVLQEAQVRIQEKNQKLKVSIPADIPDISIDPKLIHQVLMNLVTNAVKYTPENGEISVSMTQSDTEVIVEVSDTGYGIPEEAKSRIFEKFFRADNIAHKETDGTGLGLYLAVLILEVSKGRIWFESTEGQSTTFWVALPKAGSPAKAGEVGIS